LRELIQAFAADPLDDFAEQEKVDVAVDEARAGRRGRNFLDRQLDGRVLAGPHVAEIDVRPQAGHMREQMADGDIGLAVPFETRDERRDAIDQANLPVLDQHHHAGGRGHDLRQRSEIEHRVEGHRLAGRHQGAVADGLLVHDTIAHTDQDHCTGQPLLLDLLPDQRLDCLQSIEIDDAR
jgi:hypothetical protein